MKKLLSLYLIACLLFCACTKKAAEKTKPDAPNTVTINGLVYPTAVIAGKTWTTLNYRGPGGVIYDNSPDISIIGKLYSQEEAKAVSLPAGWRVPTQADYGLLLNLIGDVGDDYGIYYAEDSSKPDQLISQQGWTYGGGSNSLGFNAYPAGYFAQDDGTPLFMDLGIQAHFTTSSNYKPGSPNGTGQVWIVFYEDAYTRLTGSEWTSTVNVDRGSLRFVKDN